MKSNFPKAIKIKLNSCKDNYKLICTTVFISNVNLINH